MQRVLDRLMSGKRLLASELEAYFKAMFAGELSESQIAGFLCGLRLQGEGETELYAGAQQMRKFATVLPPIKSATPSSPHTDQQSRPTSAMVLDNCGTGGDGSNSFNISTAAAIIAASVGCKIAKHGNRSVSSKCGSADLLFQAGFPDSLSPEQAVNLFKETNFTFFFAPNFHPVMKYVMPVRKSLGIRTIFNFLGPLTNPLAPDIQIIGVGLKEAVKPIALAAKQLKISKALVIRSDDGLDEFSPADITRGFLLDHGELSDFWFDPKEIGIVGNLDDLKGGRPVENGLILEQLLNGEPVPAREGVLLNAATVIWMSGKSTNIRVGYETAKKALSSGAVKKFFRQWIDTSHTV